MLDTADTTRNHIILQHINLARRSAPLERSPAGLQVIKLKAALSMLWQQSCAKELH